MKRILLAFAALASAIACGNTDFDPQNKVDGVRILSSRADKPYAKPGDTVNLELLVADGRVEKPRPVVTAWIPIPCINPPEDLYYLCFTGSSGSTGSSSTGGQGPLGQLRPGQDVTRFLPQGPTYSFKMPDNVIIPRKSGEPYGLAILFNIVCAGRILIDEVDPSKGVQQVPISCVDEYGEKLPPTQYVIGLTRVYAYANRVNNNPVIEGLTFQGAPIDPKVGITVDRCTAKDVDKLQDCPELKVDVQVPATSNELNEGEKDVDGTPLRELVWASFFASTGTFDGDARLLYDTRTGKVGDTVIRYLPPAIPGDGTLWTVVKDNRGGAVWTDFPVHVK
ncbi:MAG: hypothetical protein HOO96_33835 [Polyangiaceae bacterium]|nr:hypothetical protein [Polyangiaceae bacterium]